MMEGGVVKEADKYVAAGGSMSLCLAVTLPACRSGSASGCGQVLYHQRQQSSRGTQADDPTSTWEPRYLGSPGR